MVHLVPVDDGHFAWLLHEAGAPAGLREPVGGVDEHDVIKMLRGATQRLHAAGCHASWLIVDYDEVVGLCGFKRSTDAEGAAEIGYGVAQSRRRRGYATIAVGLLVEEVATTKAASRLCAETARSNLASQLVLERNGFSIDGARDDAEDGELILWSRPLTV
jgi:RimJ/RimL family protein N-acetyltransferase